MKNTIALLLVVTSVHSIIAQDHSFPFGRVTRDELTMTVHDKDTSAAAVVLNEFGEAYIDSDNSDIIFQYHVKIKILRTEGLEKGNYEIPLYKNDQDMERVRTIKASAFNLDNGAIRETTLPDKQIFTENRSKHRVVKKFAIPNVRVGSVIDIMYEVQNPFLFNFQSWAFQSDIPKVYSEFWATIPANFTYNISMRGFLKLKKNENELLRECFRSSAGNADCSRLKWAMEDIPAFVEEDYMTAASNFVSAIYFELSQIEFFDGRKDKFTKEWKDADDELWKYENFGLQIKRGKDVVDESVEALIKNETDPLVKAQKIYDFVKGHYLWDGTMSKYADLGIRKAFENKKGNVGDINLSLIAALKYAGLPVEPMILSTRENGLPTSVHPVLSDFNYVVAKLNIQDKVYLLDATDKYMPFGLLPERCLNGQGRVLAEKESYWYDIKPAEREKKIVQLTLTLNPDGTINGAINTNYYGYKAAEKRRKLAGYNSIDEYIQAQNEQLDGIKILKHSILNVEDFKKPLIEKWEVEIQAYDDLNANHFLFNPFLVERWDKNPFRSNERLYPVDFGAPLEETIILTMEYPAQFQIDELPAKVGVALPNNGGRYIYEVQNNGNKLTMNCNLLIGKTVFTATEYHYLKELFNQIVQVNQQELIFKKKI
jgi:transglutaminase-like putative cysteine protease